MRKEGMEFKSQRREEDSSGDGDGEENKAGIDDRVSRVVIGGCPLIKMISTSCFVDVDFVPLPHAIGVGLVGASLCAQ